MIEGWRRIDQERMHGSDYKEQAEVKERRKKRKGQKSKKQDGFVRKAGEQWTTLDENEWGSNERHFTKIEIYG